MHTNETGVIKHLSTANADISQILKGLLLSNPKNVILPYLNVNSIRNTCDTLREIMTQNVDVLAFAGTKIDASFPLAQLYIDLI